ncbi:MULTISPECIES: Hpt domain-containing protein [Flavobacterium]|uniref:Hpt domain-containing protein n=1 Tax=Flavobacterium jumunjinense TaxID=998845 RepID=A0ABV5GL44_9FLAO|nr:MULTISPECIES: Hpt domain-containing protein [Flavobacterium]
MEKPNLNYINDLSGNDEEFKATMIGVLKKELPEEIKDYDEYIKKNDFFQASQSVHKLKHKISILGLEKSYYIAEEFENNLKSNSTALQEEFENFLRLMMNFVNDL